MEIIHSTHHPKFPPALLASALVLSVWVQASIAADEGIPVFRKTQLTDKFWAEGAAVGDLNRDGHEDIVAGPYWYEGPGFEKRHEIYPATHTFTRRKEDGSEDVIAGYEGALGVKNGYSNVFETFVYDFNGDGWPDVLMINTPGEEAAWYENPGRDGLGRDRLWKRHVIYDEIGNESPVLVDLFGSGRPVILCTAGDYLGYVTPNWEHPEEKGSFHPLSSVQPVLRAWRVKVRAGRPFAYMHGLGCGDVNGDGRLDVLGPDGWWEQPAAPSGTPIWTFHPWPFLQKRPAFVDVDALEGQLTAKNAKALDKFYRWPYTLGGAQIFVYDVNGDGLPDIISSLDAHGYGLAWFEQLPARSSTEQIRFQPHLILPATPGAKAHGVEFTQLHAVDLIDIDGDGLMDIVTGKRFWAHGPTGDVETNAPAVLYWFKLVRHPDRSAEFIPHLIDSDSGVGTQVVGARLEADQPPSIVVSNKKGTFVFVQKSNK